MNSLPSICVCGAGTMGSGIAQVFAQNGFRTILFDLNEIVLQEAEKKIKKYATDASVLAQIHFTTSINECVAAFIIEAIIENAEVKSDLLNGLSQINNGDTVFATNTSSLSVTSIAAQFSRSEKLAGMHFFNPAPLMKLVEVVKTNYTSSETTEFICQLARQLGKTPVICNDSPGFIVNRVARPYYLEALYLLEKKNAGIKIIDAMMEATGFKMGPFKLMDLIGNDVNYSVSCIVHEALGNPARLKPSVIQENKVKEGALGRKSGKGYYEYPHS